MDIHINHTNNILIFSICVYLTVVLNYVLFIVIIISISITGLFNIRGNDFLFKPFFYSFALVEKNTTR